MGLLRNLLIFPDDKWQEAADRLGGEFVQGRWLMKSEIKLSHRNYRLSLGVRFGHSNNNSTQYTKVMPHVALRPEVKLHLSRRIDGIIGSLTNGLLSGSGLSIDLPALGNDYQVIGEDAELARRIFENHRFLSALRDMPQAPTVVVGSSLRNWMDDGEAEASEGEDFCVSVSKVVKDVHQLKAMFDLTTVLLDVLEENDCIATGN